MNVFLAECGGDKWQQRILSRQEPGREWSRMWGRDNVRRWDGEFPYAFDNGIFSAWWNNKPWDSSLFIPRLRHAIARHGLPHFAVCPDLPTQAGRSLEYSLWWMGLLMGDDLLSQVNWYLAVQDGMTTGMVAPHAHSFSGIFLGGSDDFKLTADVWAAFSHSFGLKFHYARAGTINKLRHALRVGASSIDSSTPVQNGDDVFNEFAAVVDGTHPQLELFS